MTQDSSKPQEVDLDRTDVLPVLEGVVFDPDVEDDAVRMDQIAMLAVPPAFANAPPRALYRTYEKTQEAETAAFARASALATELATIRSALEAEQNRSREAERALAEKRASLESVLGSVADVQRQSERFQSELVTLRQAVAAGEANLAQALHSLGERDAQLHALQREHVPEDPQLEARSLRSAQLDAELRDVTARAEALGRELESSRGTISALMAQVQSLGAELGSTRSELGSTKMQAGSFLERLRTREWRVGFDQNLFRKLDAEAGAARSDGEALRAERELLRRRVADLEATLAAQEADIAKLREIADSDTGHAELTRDLRQSELARTELASRIAALESRQRELNGELAEREQGTAVLLAQLQETRKLVESTQTEIGRLTDELAQKALVVDKLGDENRDLRATLERTRGALEEREFLIRRLEHSESNNAAVLGRIQTSIEKLAIPATGGEDYSAELIRVDGDRAFTQVLGRRTRIGRAASCELQIEASSVSRQHALVLVERCEVIIEDLNSTNGVMVNGRRISRQLLNDGDLVMIGDIKFRLAVKQPANLPEGQLESPTAG